ARWGLVDRPDGRRKLHVRAVPVAGGLAILATAILVLSVALPTMEFWPAQKPELVRPLAGLLIASVMVCGLGVIDDLGRLRGRHKLLGQALAAGVVIAFGVRVERITLFGCSVDLGPTAVPFTLFLLLGA